MQGQTVLIFASRRACQIMSVSADFVFLLKILHFLSCHHLFDGSNHQIRLVEHDGMTALGGNEVGAIG